jgi:coenzyme F420-reducing hydrogenase delta subunit
LIVGCPEERCHYGAGAARSRVKVIQAMLKDLGIPSERVTGLTVTGSSVQEFVSAAKKIVESAGGVSL